MNAEAATHSEGRSTFAPRLAVGVVALGIATFVWVRTTNFRGFDEWVIFSLLSRGILSFPYAGRPLNLLWAVPAWLLAPDRLWGFLAVHAAWLTLAGVLTGLLVRRLLPGAPALAFLAAAFTVVWAPSDATRLASVQMIVYSGCTVGTLLAIGLLVEAWSRRRPALLLLAAASAVVTVLSIEAPLPLLALGPLLLFFAGGWRERERWARWAASWFLALAAVGWRVFWRAFADAASYQAILGAQGALPSPMRLAGRTLNQFRRHLVPLVAASASELAVAAVPVVVGVFVAAFFVAVREPAAPSRTRAAGRAAIVMAALTGAIGAALGYLPFVASPAVRGPVRTEFLSAPGVAVLLAAVVALATSCLPRRLRPLPACVLGAWVVAVGTGRTVGLQERWNHESRYGAQRRTLLELTALVPDVQPHSFLVVLQEGSAWPFDFAFNHAIDYLYEGRARGHVTDSNPLFYETRFEPDAIVWEPLPALRRAWDEPVTRFAYDECLVLREDRRGRLSLVDAWPNDLPPLPPGARYEPRRRMRSARLPRRVELLATRP